MGQDALEQGAVLGEVVVRDHEGALVLRVIRRGERRLFDDRIHREEERQRQQHREAAAEGAHARLLVELHLLFLLLLPVVLVLLLDLLELRLKRLHVLHALDLLEAQGEEDRADRDRQDDDREPVVGDEVIDPGEHPPEPIEELLPDDEPDQAVPRTFPAA